MNGGAIEAGVDCTGVESILRTTASVQYVTRRWLSDMKPT